MLDQIKLFLRDGYFDNEVPIGVEENGEYVVLEGNRRVSALKAVGRRAANAPSACGERIDGPVRGGGVPVVLGPPVVVPWGSSGRVGVIPAPLSPVDR